MRNMNWFWLTLLVLVGAVAGNILTGCGASERRTGHQVLNGITAVADPTYQMAVDSCDAARDVIVEREGTTYEQDLAAMNRINEVCDAIVLGFESLRDGQQTAREALDSGIAGAAARLIQGALARWADLQALVPQLQTLGQTAGGEAN